MEKKANGQAANAGPKHNSEQRLWEAHTSETAAGAAGLFKPFYPQ